MKGIAFYELDVLCKKYCLDQNERGYILFYYCSRYRQEMCSDENGNIKLIDEHLLTHLLAFFGLVPRCRLKLSLYLIGGLARSARGVG
jgi:hypothetical protein